MNKKGLLPMTRPSTKRSRVLCVITALLVSWLSAPSVLAASFTVSKEYRISTAGVGGLSIAWNGTNYFAVWVESQADRVFGALLRPDGRVIERVTVLATHLAWETFKDPRVAWDGSSFFVVASVSDWLSMAGAIVSSDARSVGPSVRIDELIPWNDNIYLRRPSIAGNSESKSFYVAWESRTTDGYWGIVGAPIFHEESRVTVGPATRLTINPYPPTPPNNATVASNGRNFLVGWEQNWEDASCICIRRGVYASAVTPHGVPLTRYGNKISSGSGVDSTAPSATSNGSGFLLAWNDRQYREGSGIDRKVRAARLGDSGLSQDAAPFVVTSSPHSFNPQPGIAWDGVNFIVTWVTNAIEVFGVRISPSGVRQDPVDGFLISSSAGGPAAAGAPEIRSTAIAYGKSSPNPGLFVRMVSE